MKNTKRKNYDYALSVSSDLMVVTLDGKWGFVDKTGNEVIKAKYDNVGSFCGGVAKITLNGKLGEIDARGNEQF